MSCLGLFFVFLGVRSSLCHCPVGVRPRPRTLSPRVGQCNCGLWGAWALTEVREVRGLLCGCPGVGVPCVDSVAKGVGAIVAGARGVAAAIAVSLDGVDGSVVMVSSVTGRVVGYLGFDCVLVGLVGRVGLLVVVWRCVWVVLFGSWVPMMASRAFAASPMAFIASMAAAFMASLVSLGSMFWVMAGSTGLTASVVSPLSSVCVSVAPRSSRRSRVWFPSGC